MCQDFAPRHVVQSHLAQLPLVDRGGMLPGDRRNLVGNGDQRVESLLTGDIEIRLELFGLEGIPGPNSSRPTARTSLDVPVRPLR
jgi:hypothetical protein